MRVFIITTKTDLLKSSIRKEFFEDVEEKICKVFHVPNGHIFEIINYVDEDKEPQFGLMQPKVEKERLMIKAFLEILKPSHNLGTE